MFLRHAATALLLFTCACQRAPLTLWFAGDVHLGAHPPPDLADLRTALGAGEGIVNLEGPIALGPGRAEVGASILLANPANAGTWLRHNGVVAAQVVNNHQLDLGAEGVALTRARLHAAGVTALDGVTTLRLRGVPLTVLAHESEAPGLPDTLAAELALATGTRIVSLHVTGPPSYLPSMALQQAVDAAVTGGADIVVAHGTHAVGPVERRGGTVIAWGLGNLVFDCTCTTQAEALVLRVTLGAGHPAEVLPIRAGLGGHPPVPAPDATGIFNLVDALGGTPMERVGPWGHF